MSEAIYERILDVAATLRLPAHDVAMYFETGSFRSFGRFLSDDQRQWLVKTRVPIDPLCCYECRVLIDADFILHSVHANQGMPLEALHELFDRAYRERGNTGRILLTRIRDVLNREGPESVRPIFESYATQSAPGFSFYAGRA